MKYLKISIFSLVLMLLFSTGVYALSLYGSSADKITEANASALMPEPMTAEAVTTVAGIYWLPDYLKGNISRGNDDPDKNPLMKIARKTTIFIQLVLRLKSLPAKSMLLTS